MQSVRATTLLTARASIMRLNAGIALVSPRILLVPYSPHHVPTYHAWMEDEDIREATASERLTLDEEYAMQISWREDVDKLTFIACRREGVEELGQAVDAGVQDTPGNMIGDVNLFLSEVEEDEDDHLSGHLPRRPMQLVGEVELMIATPEHQGKGYGRAVLQLFLGWVSENRAAVVQGKLASEEAAGELNRLRVKIHETNKRSLGLFESFGFKRSKEESNYFGEVEMEIDIQGLAGSCHADGGRREVLYRIS